MFRILKILAQSYWKYNTILEYIIKIRGELKEILFLNIFLE